MPGEFLIKPPICFKLVLLSVHLCKIPGIMKDLSIGYLFGLIRLLNGEQAAPQLDRRLQQVRVAGRTFDDLDGCYPWWL